MQALRLHRYGPLAQALQLDEVPVPMPGPRDLQVEVHAGSLNPIDWKLAEGGLRVVQRLALPLTLGFDLSGVVRAVGAEVRQFRPGDAVFARSTRQRLGAFAEVALVDATLAAPKPANLGHAEAASIPLVGLTTVQGLRDRAAAQPGQRILVQAGAGGVGSFAIQYARHLGLQVTATTSSRNVEFVRALGADRVIAYDQESIGADGTRWDLVYDTLGGAATLQSFDWLERGGTVVSIAGPPDRDFGRQVGAGWLKRQLFRLAGAKVQRRADQLDARYFRFLTESSGGQLLELARLYQQGVLKPVLDREFAFADSRAAFEYFRQGRARGKVVLRMR